MIYISLDSIRCHSETDEVGADEPYVIVTSVDLRTPSPVPNSRAYLYGPFDDVDDQETHPSGFQSFWGLNGEERALPNPDDAIFIVSLMENDNGDPGNLRGIIALAATGTLSATIGASRETRVSRLLQDIDSAMGTVTGAPNFDDKIGIQELRFTPGDIALAETGNPAFRALRIQGDGGDYTATFKAINRGQAAWRFCFRCHSMYFDGFSPNKGRCPAGGGHAAAGFVFFLPHEHAGPLGGQSDWLFCDNCFSMFWAGDPANQGRCPAGGRHNAQGFNFFLPHDHSGTGQDQWRFFDKCRAMFWNGEANKGVCPAGGGHNAQGFNFKLDFTP
jgi:hypothetical protein